MNHPVALVTGAAQGIGLGIARALAESGHRVALTDINVDLAERSSRDLPNAIALRLDVADSGHWSSAIEEIGHRFERLDVLVNSAGISPRGTAASTDEALWERTMAINLKGPWLGIRASLPMLKASRGAIVNIGSTRATRPMPGLFAYVTSKAGLLGLTRQAAAEGLEHGVTCNMVAPGWVDSPGERLIQAEHGRPDFPEGFKNIITPEEVGSAVAYLASPAGRRVSGVILYVDAGLHVADDAGMVYLPDAAHPRYHRPGSERRGAT